MKTLYKNRILICLLVLFSLLIIYIIPDKEDNNVIITTKLEYIDDVKVANIYLLDQNNYLGCTKIVVDSDNVEDKAKELINSLIIDGNKQNDLPSGFKPVIPPDTKINKIIYKDSVLKIDFSKELLDTDMEEQVIESIIYTLTSIDKIKYVIIYIDGNILTKLPKSNIILPSTLDRSFGINKEYNINSNKNITNTTIYYISKFNDDEYYVPVTKINNDTRDKIEIIIDELSSHSVYGSNLMSYLNNNTKVLSVNNDNDVLTINFNDAIFNDINEKDILEEVIYTISMSISDNYNINKVIFNVNDEEIYKNY